MVGVRERVCGKGEIYSSFMCVSEIAMSHHAWFFQQTCYHSNMEVLNVGVAKVIGTQHISRLIEKYAIKYLNKLHMYSITTISNTAHVHGI